MTVTRLILLDGATGTELERRGIRIDLPLWSTVALLDNDSRSILRNIHSDYIVAGADIITANTFRTNIRALKKEGLESKAKVLTTAAIDDVRHAIDYSRVDRNIVIAGSVAPVEDCYSPELVPTDTELESEHHRHIDYLYEAGAGIFLIETMNTIREARIALEYAKKTGRPVYISFICRDGEHLLSGEKLTDALIMAETYSPDIISVNCATTDIIEKNLKTIRDHYSGRIGAYANILSDQVNKNSGFTYSLSPDEYARQARNWLYEYNLTVAGGCCGSTPDHIRAIKQIAVK